MPDGKPNILVIWGDDIGITNLSCYSDGLMGYRTPSIDRIAQEGMRFTDAYGEQSCTAGRAAFISGQSVYRTGLSKVGLPGAEAGIQAEDPTIAELLKPLGYATGQYGKNHFGDRDEHLPTNHGFDEFFGNLYHLKRRRGARARGLPGRRAVPELPRQLRSARRAALPARRGRIPGDRGHRPADTQADGDHRRRDRRRRNRLRRAQARRARAVLPVAQHDPHALPHAHEAHEPRLLLDIHFGVRDPTKGTVRTDLRAEGSDRNKVAKHVPARALRVADRIAGRVGVGKLHGSAEPYLCHTLCELAAEPLDQELRAIRRFLDGHRGAVLIAIVEDYVPRALERAFTQAGSGASSRRSTGDDRFRPWAPWSRADVG